MKRKDIQKILMIAIINYFLILIISLGLSFILPILFDIILLIITILSTYLLMYGWYFSVRPESPLKEGLLAGSILLVVTFIIELSIWFSTFGWVYFLNLTVIIQYSLILIIPILAAYFKPDEIELRKRKSANWKQKIK